MSHPFGPSVLLVDVLGSVLQLGIPIRRALAERGVAARYVAPGAYRNNDYSEVDIETFVLLRRFRRLALRSRRFRLAIRAIELPFIYARLFSRVRGGSSYAVLHFMWAGFPRLDRRLVRFARKRGIRCVLTICNLYEHADGVMRHGMAELCAEVDMVMTLSEAVRRQVVDEFPDLAGRVIVVPRGGQEGYLEHEARGDVEALAPLKSSSDGSGGSDVLCIGLIKPYKGVELLLDAWPSVVAQRPEARLRLVGDLRDGCEATVPAALDALAPDVRATIAADFAFVSNRDYAEHLARSSVLVQSYTSASQSGNSVEALAFGCVLVCTDVGALAEPVDKGVTGFVTSAGPTPEELADAIVAGLDHARRPRTLGACVAAAEERSWERVAERLVAAYRAPLAGEG